MNMKSFTGAVSLAALIGGTVIGPANAQTIYLGLQEAGYFGGAIQTIGSGAATDGFAASLTFGSFKFVSGSGYGETTDPSGFGSTIQAAILKGQKTASVLNVYFTETDLPGKVAPATFFSGLTTNGLSTGWTVTQSVYIDPTDGAPFTVPLSSQIKIATDSFSAASAFSNNFSDIVSGLNKYSVTEFYQITSPGGAYSVGSALSTATVSTSVPEISTWAMMFAGFAGLGLVGFGRNKKARAVEA